MKTKAWETETILNVVVDYSQSLRQMIEAGRYDETSEDINAREFRLEAVGCRHIEMMLVQFNDPVAPLEVVTLMKKQSCRPATIEELLALGRSNPDLQRSIPIIALGSARMIKNRRFVPCLGGSPSTRTLTLAVIYRRWSTCYRFAFVRE